MPRAAGRRKLPQRPARGRAKVTHNKHPAGGKCVHAAWYCAGAGPATLALARVDIACCPRAWPVRIAARDRRLHRRSQKTLAGCEKALETRIKHLILVIFEIGGLLMRIDKLTTKFQEALADAQSLAVGNDNQYIEPVHVLTALMAQQDGSARSLLSRAGVHVQPLQTALNDACSPSPTIKAKRGVWPGSTGCRASRSRRRSPRCAAVRRCIARTPKASAKR